MAVSSYVLIITQDLRDVPSLILAQRKSQSDTSGPRLLRITLCWIELSRYSVADNTDEYPLTRQLGVDYYRPMVVGTALADRFNVLESYGTCLLCSPSLWMKKGRRHCVIGESLSSWWRTLLLRSVSDDDRWEQRAQTPKRQGHTGQLVGNGEGDAVWTTIQDVPQLSQNGNLSADASGDFSQLRNQRCIWPGTVRNAVPVKFLTTGTTFISFHFICLQHTKTLRNW